MAGPQRLVFLGSDAIALPLLNWLANAGRATAEVVAVFTQPDRPHGRGQRVAANAIKQWALAQGLPVHQPERFDESARVRLAEYQPDVSLVMAYGHILREAVIDTPRLGTLNLHTSILPRYRGASPIQTAVAMGEKETGVSLMRIVPELDAGPVADVARVPIGETDTALVVEQKLAAASVPLAARNLPKLAAGELEFREQETALVTYCRRLNKADGVLDFTRPAAELAARINGLYPWPTCGVEMMGVPVKLGEASARPAGDAFAPGTVLAGSGDQLDIATGAGVLELRRLQRPGGKMLPAAEFLRGFPVPVDTRLVSLPMPVLAGPQPLR